MRPICRPGQNQRVLYNVSGHKKVHAIKFQSIVVPNGLDANLFGPVEGKRHDRGMLDYYANCSCFRLMQMVHPLRTWGPSISLPLHLQGPSRRARLTSLECVGNQSMREVRVAVEWILGILLIILNFLTVKKIENKSKSCW